MLPRAVTIGESPELHAAERGVDGGRHRQDIAGVVRGSGWFPHEPHGVTSSAH